MCAARSPTPVTGFSDDPQLGPAQERPVSEALMGDIIRPGRVPMRLTAEVIGTAPVERVDVLHGTRVAQTVRPYAAADLGRRVRVLWEGAEYRGRGRETVWQGRLNVEGNRIARFEPVNFLNPERGVSETAAGSALAWSSVTTGNLAGIDLWLDEGRRGKLQLETNIVSGEVDLATLDDGIAHSTAAGSAASSASIACPSRTGAGTSRSTHEVTFPGGADLPVYLRVTQADGHQAWSSPIYLIA